MPGVGEALFSAFYTERPADRFPDAFDDVWIKVLRLGFVTVEENLLAIGDFDASFAFTATRHHDECR